MEPATPPGRPQAAEAMPDAEFVEVSESVGHRLDAEATARIVAARVAE